MVDAVSGLIAGEPAFFTFGSLVEPVSIGVELGFDEIFIGYYIVSACKFAGFGPGVGFQFDSFDICYEAAVP